MPDHGREDPEGVPSADDCRKPNDDPPRRADSEGTPGANRSSGDWRTRLTTAPASRTAVTPRTPTRIGPAAMSNGEKWTASATAGTTTTLQRTASATRSTPPIAWLPRE